jgi:hypothetical protein
MKQHFCIGAHERIQEVIKENHYIQAKLLFISESNIILKGK